MKSYTLQTRFRLWTVLLVVVPGLLIMAIYTVGQITAGKQKNQELINQRVDFQKRLIEYWIEERSNDTRRLSQMSAFQTFDEQLMKNTLDVMQQNSKHFDSLSYIDQDGFFRMSTLTGGIRFASTAGQPYFEAAKAGQEYVSDVVIGRNSGLPIINFSAPIYDESGIFRGLILGSVRTTTIEALLRDNWFGQTGEILLVNREGTMVAEPRYANILIDRGIITGTSKMKVKLPEDALRHIRLGESGTASWIDYLGNKVIGAYQHMPERGWTLIGSIGEKEILAPIYVQLGMMAGGTLVLVLLILPLATSLTNQIKRPIDWLIVQSHLVSAEEYGRVGEVACMEKMPYELSNLCDIFVTMSRKIATSVDLLKENETNLASKVLEIQDINTALKAEINVREEAQTALQQLNNKLEDKVLERTRQLQDINATLEAEIKRRQIVQDALSDKTEEMRKMAYTDALTGLPNRAHLRLRIEEELEKGRQGDSAGAILFIDLDDLKTINDTFGHKYGDAIIVASGQRIVEVVGEAAFVARLGGDEFIVLLPGEHDRKCIERIVGRIRDALSQDMATMGICLRLSASIGIAMYPEDGDTAEEVCKNADNAMYAAKKAGKNCGRFYEASMQTEAYEKIMLTNSLRNAIAREELVLYYQPQVNTNNGTIVGFEALLRWNSPEYGPISPARFIPLAEQNGLIHNIGTWVLREACQFMNRLSSWGWGHLHVAVNVSPLQLCSNGFVDIVRATIQDANIEPRQLEIEITENALMGSLEEGSEKLTELRKMGVRLALDDFGKGYSSLTYLMRLPVNSVKIDKAFIDMIKIHEVQKTIISTIIEMAHQMEMTVVAEGVETAQQIEYLKQCSCDRFQGFVISRPVTEDEAVRLLSNESVRSEGA